VQVLDLRLLCNLEMEEWRVRLDFLSLMRETKKMINQAAWARGEVGDVEYVRWGRCQQVFNGWMREVMLCSDVPPKSSQFLSASREQAGGN
jgi:hypothetical protein